MKRAKIIGAAIIALLAIIIFMQNTESVTTKLLFVTVTMPRAVLLVVTLLAGFILGVLTPGRLIRKARKEAGLAPQDEPPQE